MGKILNIKIHYSWIIVIALVTAIVTTQFAESYPLWQRVIFGLIVSIIYFLAVLGREIVLGTTAFRRETPVRKVTLFAFGGVYRENKDRILSTHQPLLYMARYLSNFIIAVAFYGLYATFISIENLMLAGIAQWLTYIYFIVFLLHFVPAFPLDGGEILRLVLWKLRGDYYKATDIASFVGWITGWLLLISGALIFVISRQWMISLVILSSAWIMLIAAGPTRRYIKAMIALRYTKAEDVMTREYPVISGDINISELIREYVLKKGWQYIVVTVETQPAGIATLEQIKSTPWRRWNTTNISQIMTPCEQIKAFNPQETADIIFDEMYQRNIDYVPVLEEDNFTGIVSRSALRNVVKIRNKLGV